ncbi:MAG: YbaN family protein [Leptospiraceae bacterium]|nr:YbaN family protein [Leptospiraceae bacterium]
MNNDSKPREAVINEARELAKKSRISNPLIRAFLILIGFTSLALGIVGVFLPVLPTTPFLLLTAACFLRSSEKFYIWILTNKWFGPYVYKWRIEKKIPLPIKIYAISLLTLTLGSTIIFFINFFPAKIILTLIGFGVSYYIASFPSK